MPIWNKDHAEAVFKILGSLMVIESFVILYTSYQRFPEVILAMTLFLIGKGGISFTESEKWHDLFEPKPKVYKIRKVKRK